MWTQFTASPSWHEKNYSASIPNALEPLFTFIVSQISTANGVVPTTTLLLRLFATRLLMDESFT